MRIRFWGVRGSIPTPPTSVQIKEKIRKVAQRIVSENITDQNKVNALIDSMSSVDAGLIGGNTSVLNCVPIIKY
jgi:hypothetical protein